MAEIREGRDESGGEASMGLRGANRSSPRDHCQNFGLLVQMDFPTFCHPLKKGLETAKSSPPERLTRGVGVIIDFFAFRNPVTRPVILK